MSKQPSAKKCRSSTSTLSSHNTLLKYWTSIAQDVHDEGRPAQPTACVDVEKQSPVEAHSYPNSTYHNGHTDIVILLSKMASRLRQRRRRQF
jgi:hypothetical protein